MISHIHHALAQVQQLKRQVLEKQRFKGYSGRARAISGTLALLAAAVVSWPHYPQTVAAQLIGWGTLFTVCLLLNYGALLYWFVSDPAVNRNLRRLKPTLDALPPLFVGGLLTWLLIRHGLHHQLFGLWMCLYGLANVASRHVLPRLIGLLGAFYIACGTACLLAPGISLFNPWIMGLVFFCGEWTGGIIFHYDRVSNLSMADLFIDFLFSTSGEVPHVE